MNEQNSPMKVIGPVIGFVILAYVVNLGVTQLNRDSAALGERPVAEAAAELAAEEVLAVNDTPATNDSANADSNSDANSDGETAEEATEEATVETSEEVSAADTDTSEAGTEATGETSTDAPSGSADVPDTEAETEAEASEPTSEEVAADSGEADSEAEVTDNAAEATAGDGDGAADAAEVTETEPADSEAAATDGEDTGTTADAETQAATGDGDAGGDAGGDAPITLEIQTGDLFFGEGGNNLVDPPIWTISSGQEVALTFSNMGGVQHNWAVLNQGVEEVPIPFFEEENADLLFFNPGLQDPGTHEFAFGAPDELGEYLVICTAPGHYPLMQGRLVVQ